MTDALAPRPGIRFSDEQTLAWLRLIRSENVGPATFRDLINHFGTASAALENLPDLASRGNPSRKIVVTSLDQALAEKNRLEHIGGQLVCMGEPHYPAALRSLEGAPPVISVLGNVSVLAGKAIGIGFAGRAWGTEPELSITERGAIRLVSKNEAIGRGRWTDTLTILYRDGQVVVGGYTYTARDTLDLEYRYDCDVNLFNGKGVFNDQPFRSTRRAMPIDAFERDGICPEG